MDQFLKFWDRCLPVKGKALDRGFQQGEFFREHRLDLLKAIKQVPLLNPVVQKLIPVGAYRFALHYLGKKYKKLHAPLLANHDHRAILERFDGLAKGFGMPFELLYGINAYEVLSSKLPYSLGCTSLAFHASQIAEGVPLLAYNHDFPASFGNFLFVRRNEPSEGYASLSLTYPPLVGAIAGINEKGLAISLNHAFATDFENQAAFFITLLVELCLEQCANVSEALALIEKLPVPNGSIATLADEKGNRASIELSPTRKAVRHAKGDAVHFTFNYYQEALLQSIEIPMQAMGKGPLKGLKVHGHNIERKKRFEEIFKHDHSYSEKSIRELLSDHDNGNGRFGTLCRHHAQTANTLASAIISPCQKSMKVIFGFPCEKGEYKNFVL